MTSLRSCSALTRQARPFESLPWHCSTCREDSRATVLASTTCALTALRHSSTTRRTTSRLRHVPGPSARSDNKYTTPTTQSIIFNPPPTPPSPYQTPPAFLPRNDPRRSLLARAYAYANPYGGAPASMFSAPSTPPSSPSSSPPSTASTSRPSASSPGHVPLTPRLPPAVRQPYEKKYHLTAEQIQEIRRLRGEDPWLHTRKSLAERFGCSEFFVGMCAPTTPERIAWAKASEDRFRNRWGPRRQRARVDRQRRREIWARDG